MSASNFFNFKQKEQILLAIQEAEMATSGEIKLHIENRCNKDVLERSKEVFYNLKMDKTEEKNGVLIYLSIYDRFVAIIGDEGIDKLTLANYWNQEVNTLLEYFEKNEFTEGIIQVISDIGVKLQKYFPYKSNDINELSDQISIYEN